MSIEIEMTIPYYATVAETPIHIGEYQIRLNVEADESLGDADWYVASVDILGNAPAQVDTWHRLPEAHDIARTMRIFAYDKWSDAISRKWAEFLSDKPVRKTPFRVIGGGRS